MEKELLEYIALLEDDSFAGWNPDECRGYLEALSLVEKKIYELSNKNKQQQLPTE